MFDDDDNGPSAESIKEKLASMGAKGTMGIETAPSTGRMHIHVYAHCEKGFNTRDVKKWDVGIYHPNVKLITTRHDSTWDYVTKGGHIPIADVPRPQKASKRSHALDEVFKSGLQQDTAEAMLKTIQDGAPARYTTSYLNIRACARDHFPTEPDPEYVHPRDAPFDISRWPELDSWVTTYLPNIGSLLETQFDTESVFSNTPSLTSGPSTDTSSIFSGENWGLDVEERANDDTQFVGRYASPLQTARTQLSGMQTRPKSLILWGPSRTGKTCWARSLGKHVHHANTTNMELHQHDVEYAVFDDIDDGLRSFNYKGWLGGQLHFSVTDKYMKKKSITWGKPCIYIANANPYDSERGIDSEWLLANTVIVEIDRPMYKS